MNEPQLLFDDDPPAVPRHRRTDPIASKIAAQRQTPERLSRGRWLVLDALGEHGPQTDHELAARTGLVVSSAGKRRGDLMRHGWVIALEERRPSPSGSPCTIWELTGDGRVAWSELSVRQADGAS